LLRQFLEAALRLRIEELVVLEFLHLAGGIARQLVEEVLLPLGDALQHLAELLLVVAAGLTARLWLATLRGVATLLAGLALLPLLAALPSLGLTGHAGLLLAHLAALALLTVGVRIALRALLAFALLAFALLVFTAGLLAGLLTRGLALLLAGLPLLAQAVTQGFALKVEDLVQLAADVLHHAAHVVLVQPLAPHLAQLLEEVAQALHAIALGRVHPALHQVPQRMLQISEVHEVV